MDIGELFEGEASQFGDVEYQDNDAANIKQENEAADNQNNNSNDGNPPPRPKARPRMLSKQQQMQIKKAQIQRAVVNAVSTELEAQDLALDAKLAKLEDQNLTTDELDELRANRMEELQRKARKKQEWMANAHGVMNEISDQKRFFEHVKTSKHVICLFYNKSNKYCVTLMEHLTLLARKHLECKFLCIMVDNAPYLMERLNIWMVPTLVCATNNKVDRQLRGLDWCAPSGKIDTIVLEQKLFEFGFFEETYLQIEKEFNKYTLKKNGKMGATKYASDSDDDLFD